MLRKMRGCEGYFTPHLVMLSSEGIFLLTAFQVYLRRENISTVSHTTYRTIPPSFEYNNYSYFAISGKLGKKS